MLACIIKHRNKRQTRPLRASPRPSLVVKTSISNKHIKMQMTILLTLVASMFLLVLSKSANTLNEAAELDTANKVVSLTADKAEAHRLVKRQADFEFEAPEVTFLQCQSLGVTPFTGLPLTTVTSLFAQADTDNNSVLTNFELLVFGNAMQVYLQCANPFGEFET